MMKNDDILRQDTDGRMEKRTKQRRMELPGIIVIDSKRRGRIWDDPGFWVGQMCG